MTVDAKISNPALERNLQEVNRLRRGNLAWHDLWREISVDVWRAIGVAKEHLKYLGVTDVVLGDGYVRGVEISVKSFWTNFEQLQREVPRLEILKFTEAKGVLHDFCMSYDVKQLRTIGAVDLSDNDLTDQDVEQFVTSRSLYNLLWLNLMGNPVTEKTYKVIAYWTYLRNLQYLGTSFETQPTYVRRDWDGGVTAHDLTSFGLYLQSLTPYRLHWLHTYETFGDENPYVEDVLDRGKPVRAVTNV